MPGKFEGQEIFIQIIQKKLLQPPVDARSGRPIPVLATANVSSVIILEDGTVNNKPSLMLMGTYQGSVVALEITGATFKTINGAILGLEQRLAGEIISDFMHTTPDNRSMYIDFKEIDTKDIDVVEMRGMDTNKVSDGYHTFGELYEHRITNYLVLCRELAHNPKRHDSHPVWRSKNHSDGQPAYGGGWFVLGIGTEPGQQITYHLPIAAWDKTWFAKELDKAPEFDGHTPADVLNRLAEI
jgi:hypothetical protein